MWVMDGRPGIHERVGTSANIFAEEYDANLYSVKALLLICFSMIRTHPWSFSTGVFFVLIETEFMTLESVDCNKRVVSTRCKIYPAITVRVV